jgi:AcrR family transcriptional regulator
VLIACELFEAEVSMTPLTEKLVDAAMPAEKPYFLWDDRIHGFGVKITPTGHKAFVLQYRLGGRQAPTRRYTIGRYGNLTAAQARQIAQDAQAAIARGIDPAISEQQGHAPAVSSVVGQADRTMSSRSKTAARIAAVAKRIFLREGYRASLDLIAEAAGVTKRTLYNHFQNKEYLFRAVVEDFFDETLAPILAIERRGDIRATLKTYLERYLETVLAPDSIAFYRLLIVEARDFPDLPARGFTPVSTRLVGVLVDYLAEEIAAGRLLPLDPQFAAERLLGGVAGPIRLPALLGLPAPDPDRLRQALDDAIDSFARGMGAPETPA